MPRVNFQHKFKEEKAIPTELKLICTAYGPYLTIQQAAECLHRSYETVYGFIRSGELTAHRTGRHGGYLIPAPEIIRFLQK